MKDSCTIGVEVVTMNDGPSSLPRHRRSYHASWSSWNSWEPLSTSTTTKPLTIKTFTQLPLSLNSVQEPIQSSLWSSHREYPSCKGYNLFAYQLLMASGGFIQLIASGFFIRGIYRVRRLFYEKTETNCDVPIEFSVEYWIVNNSITSACKSFSYNRLVPLCFSLRVDV